MLEYFTYKKAKKHQTEKRAREHVQSPLLNEEDENFLGRIVFPEGPAPPLPERRQHGEWVETGDSTENTSQMVVHDGNGNGPRVKTAEEEEEDDLNAAIAASLADSKDQNRKDKGKGKQNEKDAKKTNRFSFLTRSLTKKDKKRLSPTTDVPPAEAANEEDDITRVLNDLNLAAVNNRAFSISKESQELVQKFTVILKDLINGVPTAYDDLTHLLDDSQGTLAKSYDHLPSFLQKLVTQLPDKLTKNLAPELLAVATEAQAFNKGGKTGSSSSKGGFTSAAKNFLRPTSLKDLVAKPGAVVSLLKTIMNALKMRWPAFMGTNVLLSLALFVLLFVFWYCHKRGREVRLAKEQGAVDSNGRIVDLDDDPMLDNGRPGASRSQTDRSQRNGDRPSSGRPESGRSHHGDRDTSGTARTETERSHRRDRDPAEPERRPASSRQTSSRQTTSRGSERERRPRSAEYATTGGERERRSNERH